MLFHSCLKIPSNVYIFFCAMYFLCYFTFGVLTGNNDTIKGLELMVFNSSPVVLSSFLHSSLVSILHPLFLFPAGGLF